MARRTGYYDFGFLRNLRFASAHPRMEAMPSHHTPKGAGIQYQFEARNPRNRVNGVPKHGCKRPRPQTHSPAGTFLGADDRLCVSESVDRSALIVCGVSSRFVDPNELASLVNEIERLKMAPKRILSPTRHFQPASKLLADPPSF